jgi:hypothetical protein
MTTFRPCASPACTACQEVRRLREVVAEIHEYVLEPGNWSALDGRRAHLLRFLMTALEDGAA